jgi:hypothetical protein
MSDANDALPLLECIHRIERQLMALPHSPRVRELRVALIKHATAVRRWHIVRPSDRHRAEVDARVRALLATVENEAPLLAGDVEPEPLSARAS